MALVPGSVSKVTANFAASNVLKVSIVNITANQSWRTQVRGVYSLLYPLMTSDFTHLKDINLWIKQSFNTHKHSGVHGPTSPPIGAGKSVTPTLAKRLLVAAPPLGVVRIGLINNTVSTVGQIFAEQST